MDNVKINQLARRVLYLRGRLVVFVLFVYRDSIVAFYQSLASPAEQETELEPKLRQTPGEQVNYTSPG